MVRIKRIIRQYHGFVIAGSILVFCALAIFTAVVPGIRVTLSLYEQFQTLTHETETLASKLSYLESLDEDKLTNQLQALVAALPLDKSIPSIFATIDGLAAQSGVSITDIVLESPGSIATGSAINAAVSKSSGSPELMLSLSAQGSLDEMRHLFGQIQNVRRLLSIKNFDVNINASGFVNFHGGLVTYYRALPANFDRSTQALPVITEKEEALLGKVASMESLSQAMISRSSVSGSGKTDPFLR